MAERDEDACNRLAGSADRELNLLIIYRGNNRHEYLRSLLPSPFRCGLLDWYRSEAAVPNVFSALALEAFLIPNVSSLMVAQILPVSVFVLG